MLISIIVIGTLLSGNSFAELDAVPAWVWILSVVIDSAKYYFTRLEKYLGR